MKRILKIIFLSFISVIGAGALLIGGMYLFGGFNEEIIYADNIAFSSTEVVSSEPFAMKITTATENVNRTTLKLSVLAGGESVIEFPSRVEIGEIFHIIPKQVDGVNFGGNVTLKAEYDGDDSNKNAVAFCEILIDVPVKDVSLDISSISDDRITIPGQTILVCQKDEPVSSVFGINPTHALMPYVNFGDKKVTNVVDKVLYLELVDKLGHALQNTAAQFYVGESEEPQNSNRIAVGYKYRESDKKIVFTDNVIIKTKNVQTDVVVNAYVYSTYKDQNSNTDLEGVVSFNKETVKGNNFAFTVGEYRISDMLLNTENKEVYLFEDSKIFLNNPNANGQDINLGLQLVTESEGIIVDDLLLLRTYIKIDNQPYRLLTNALGSNTAVDNWVSVNYSGISTEKQNWYWIININNYLAYKNNVPFNVSIKYQDEETEIVKSFRIIPKLFEINSVTVSYEKQEDTSFKVESNNTDKNLDLNNKFSINSNLNSNRLGFYSLEYFLSYNENFANGKSTVVTVPNVKNSYKINFSFQLDEDGVFKSLTPTGSWCETLSKYTLAQDGTDSFVWEAGNPVSGSNSNFVKDKPINVEVILNLKSAPINETLFYVSFLRTENLDENIPTISIDDFGVKFYEKNGTSATGDTYSSLPYLTVNGITYKTDFDFYFDELSSTKFLRIKELNTSLYGIGSFVVTAQAIFNDITNNASYWVGKSAGAVIDVYQNLSSITIYSYQDETNYKKGFETTVFDENDGAVRYLFITSPELEALKNYVNSAQQLIELSSVQTFDLVFTDDVYKTIYEKNTEAITFGSSWIEVTNENGILVGYRRAYYINEVRSICVEDEDLPNKFNITVKARVNGEDLFATFMVGADPIEKSVLEFEVKDYVVKTAVLTYNGVSNYNTESNPYQIYAGLQINQTENTNKVIYKEAVANGSPATVDFAKNLKYAFVYDGTSQETKETMVAKFTVEDDSNISTDNLFDFSLENGLTFYNFPRLENGVLIKMTLTTSTTTDSPLNFNCHYVWDSESKKFVDTPYDLTACMYFKVYGLDLKIQTNEDENAYAVKDSNIPLFDDNATKGIFNITVNSLNPHNDRNSEIYSKIFNYNDLLKIYINNSMITLSDDGKNIIPTKDFVEDSDAIIRFYVGSNANSNLVKIYTSETTTVSSYSKLIKSPYIVEAIKEFEAPSKNQNFLTLSCEGVADYTTKFNASIQIVSTTLDEAYGISNPIKVEEGNLLSFITVPVDYKAVIKVILLTTEATPRVREEEIEISVKAILDDDNIIVGELVDEDYCLLAGLQNTISVGDGIEFVDGKPLKDLVNNITKVDITFVDGEIVKGNFVESADSKVSALAHMKYSHFDDTLNSFSIWSEDLNYQKYVKVTITIYFVDENNNDYGYYIFNKIICVKPNLELTLKKSTYTEGNRINLTSSDTYNFVKDGIVEELDILSYFNYEGGNYPYSINSFDFEGKSAGDLAIFTDISGTTLDFEGVEVAILNGASALCGGKTQIKFYYVVSNHDKTYNLEFVFDININFVYSDNNIIVGEVDNVDDSKFNLTAGESAKISLGNGISFVEGSQLANNKKNIKDIQVSFTDTDNLDTIKATNLMVCNINKIPVSESENNWEISIWSRNINISKNVSVNFVFTMQNGQEVSITKIVTVKPNITFGLVQDTFVEGEIIDLGNALNYVILVNNQNDLTFSSNLVSNCEITASSDVFDLSGKTFTVKVGASEVCEGKSTITFTYQVKTSSTLLYTLTFDYEVEIKQA